MKKAKSLFDLNDFLALCGFVILVIVASMQDLGFLMLAVAGGFLAVGISSSVHYAEVIAKRIGPSLGTLVLALSVTVIEVALIVNLMRSNPETGAAIARDTVFAAIMIVANGITGISLLFAGWKQKELGFQAIGTSSLMGSLATLAALTMVLPNYTTSTTGPTYNNSQLIFISVVAILLYLALVWAQTKSHKNYFEPITEAEFKHLEEDAYVPSKKKTILSLVGLMVSLVVVVGLAKVLSPMIGNVVAMIGAPASAVGIVVALLVLAPETFAALSSAKANQLQTSLNLALGSGAASIALTIPVVSIYSIYAEQPLILGLDPKGIVFLLLTFIAGGFTFGSGRTTALHGIVHLMILFSYIVMSFIP